ncbi:hypothetical protein TCELL_0152 [Thermogladius calderae 1633]|uniref:Cren protein n=1 Tax=Thermogladius calderae (strain DSM 22663 / VKM B-2946 / 1633) TaxID=1184251 RepID=I3TCT9_THEC1|nr:hypothetical protein TCELL_0152 [Thermogladius calderae 1633]
MVPVKLGSLSDLVRLAATISMPQGTSYILRFETGDKVVLGILGVFRDYYKYYGIPVFYYYIAEGKEAEDLKNTNYIVASLSEDRFEFSKHPKPGLTIPLIRLAAKPDFIPDLQ